MSAPQPSPAEEQVIALLAAARARDRAPASLRARVERERRAAHPRRRRLVYGGSLAAALAAAALVFALALPGGSPTVAQAAALGLRAPTAPVPGAAPHGPKLGESVGDVYFPNWESGLGWRAVGERRDRLDGHAAVTVYYVRAHAWVAYTILGAPALPEPSAASLRSGPLVVRTFSLRGRTVITWRRHGATCVLSSEDVNAATLAALAAGSSGVEG